MRRRRRASPRATRQSAARADAEARVIAGEAEFKGNVRVFCRVRPPHAGEKHVVQTSEKAVLVNAVNFSGKRETKRFEFDRVFGVSQQQTDV